MIKLAEAERILQSAKALKAAVAKYERKRTKAGELDYRTVSEKRIQSVNASLAQDAHEIEVLECHLHAVCVVGGIADQRAAEEYEERLWRMSSWHEYKWTPTNPAEIRGELAPGVSEKPA